MSRILRRPMFRGGGKVSSYGNGIASGLADGGKVQPLLVGQHPESAKGPDGREKHFESPIRTTPWGSIKCASEYELPDDEMQHGQKLAHEPDYLKAGELRTITKDQFKKYEWEAA